MAKIKKIKEGTATVYPATIPQAVVDPTSGKSVRTELNEKEAVANKKQTVTNSATDYPSGAGVTASLALKTDISELNKIYPLYNYNVRVGLDSGLIKDLSHLTELYIKNLSLLDSTVFLWNGEAGTKRRISGSNTFASKLYNMANKVQQFGSELVTNGTFTGADGSTPAGWTASSATLTISSNRLKVLNSTGSGFGTAFQSFTTVKDKTYHLSYSFIKDVNSVQGLFRVRDSSPTGTDIVSKTFAGASESGVISFVALSTTTVLRLSCNTANINEFALFDNISVKQMDWVDGTNDAVSTTEANQPYFGGLIAPNEVGKFKHSLTRYGEAFGTQIQFAQNENWSFTSVFNWSGMRSGSALNGTLLGSSGYIYIDGSSESARIVVMSVIGGVTTNVFVSAANTIKAGVNYLIQVVYSGSGIKVLLNGIEIQNTVTFTSSYMLFTSVGNLFNLRNTADIIHAQIFNRAISASEIQAQHDFLRLQIPEIEGIAIGNQHWATSNYEGVVAGDGSVIPEVQYDKSDGTGTNNSPEKITGGDFESGLIGTLSTGAATANWSLNTDIPITGSQDGRLIVSAVGPANYRPSLTFKMSSFMVGKRYRVKIKNKVNSGIAIITDIYSGINHPQLSTLSGTDYIYYITATRDSVEIQFDGRNLFDLQIDDVSIKEASWADSTALYDAVYAQTSGTAAVKELAALKAAAMWCYYDNDVNNGAIYGKLYNWYAVKLISLYPPQGWRVPTSADFTHLQTYLGGSTVAGGKMKALYGSFNNSFATNESGLTILPTGRRDPGGTFTNSSNFFGYNGFLTSDNFSVTAKSDSASLQIQTNVVYPTLGSGLRLLRNSPVGPNEKTITSTTIVSDISSTANSTQIPFGYSVASIRLKTTANLTNIKVELWNNFYSGTPTLVSTLITGKTANNTTMVFPVLADAAALLQDGTLRIAATGAATFETIVEYNLQKNTF